MNILVTGGAGFIASHIVDALIKNKHKVIIVDDLSNGKKENINPEAIFYKLNICNSNINNIFKKYKVDILNHHAAQIDVRKSVKNPVFDAKINILGSLNLLENCIKYKVKKVIFASTGGAMYGNVQGPPASESSPLCPLSPYTISKCSIEYYIKYYQFTYGLPYTILRYANVYGERQDPLGEAGVIAIFTKIMLEKGQPVIYGDGNQLRDYVYISDVVRANLLAMNGGKNQIFNIGTGVGTSVNTIYKKLSHLTGFKKKPIHLPPRFGELRRSKIDFVMAFKILGWEPLINLDEGLVRTVKYFVSCRNMQGQQ